VSYGFCLMGILNVTPDSFSDGGRFLDRSSAIAHARELVNQGAQFVDVGGESTRPGAEPVSEEQERGRVLPVIEELAVDLAARISIDTCKSAVAQAALGAGASLVNDVSALRGDPQMAGVVAQSGAQCCLMHMLGEPRTMQRAGGPKYEDVVDDVKAFLEERLSFAVREGVDEQKVLLDPGIGFGKTIAHNLELLRRLDELVAIGRPIVIGTSRKSFLGHILAEARGQDEPVATPDRLTGTLATCVMALERGASIFRVHDVAPVRDALTTAAATLHGTWTQTSQTSPTSS
jgi:dihydropteroate synthase